MSKMKRLLIGSFGFVFIWISLSLALQPPILAGKSENYPWAYKYTPSMSAKDIWAGHIYWYGIEEKELTTYQLRHNGEFNGGTDVPNTSNRKFLFTTSVFEGANPNFGGYADQNNELVLGWIEDGEYKEDVIQLESKKQWFAKPNHFYKWWW